MRKLIVLIFYFGIASHTINAQQFKCEAKLDSTARNGFFNILLSPEITGFLNTDFSDIRLYDNKNIEIPYLHRTEVPITYTKLFKEYKVISKENSKGGFTRLILNNPERSKINNISLVIKNADVQKKVRLSGSDDQQNWFVIKDNYLFYSVYSNSETSEIKLLNFPLSNYLYYKIEINDSLSAPINVLKAGYYDTYSESGKFTDITGMQISQIDSAKLKRTYVRFQFNSPQFIDKLELEIEGPIYYLRKVSVGELRKDSVKKRGVRSYIETLQDTEIASNRPNTIYFSNYKTKEFYLIIENEDNQPVRIRSAKAYQLNHYLTAYLEKGKQYVLKFGDEQMGSSSYDLKYFNDSIPKTVPLLLTGKVNVFTKEEIKHESSWFKNKAILWVVMSLVILLLGVLSVKMIKEMKSR